MCTCEGRGQRRGRSRRGGVGRRRRGKAGKGEEGERGRGRREGRGEGAGRSLCVCKCVCVCGGGVRLRQRLARLLSLAGVLPEQRDKAVDHLRHAAARLWPRALSSQVRGEAGRGGARRMPSLVPSLVISATSRLVVEPLERLEGRDVLPTFKLTRHVLTMQSHQVLWVIELVVHKRVGQHSLRKL